MNALKSVQLSMSQYVAACKTLFHTWSVNTAFKGDSSNISCSVSEKEIKHVLLAVVQSLSLLGAQDESPDDSCDELSDESCDELCDA